VREVNLRRPAACDLAAQLVATVVNRGWVSGIVEDSLFGRPVWPGTRSGGSVPLIVHRQCLLHDRGDYRAGYLGAGRVHTRATGRDRTIAAIATVGVSPAPAGAVAMSQL